ncbi:hypothetical protein DPEC_G00135020 [Dallia pectoralis]|uniref:Uncharacterized protein n=1 Tax=Dallia pectoralis TaxID=75939 RepID=A0ACC2GRN8_DALPE|nr:hypothetical protein DPEC_G00135020 [Dallia pectoralis]
MMSAEFPPRPWSTVGAGLFQIDNKQYLVIVDYFSRYFEVAKPRHLTSGAVIDWKSSLSLLNHSIPEVVRSDMAHSLAETFQMNSHRTGVWSCDIQSHFPQSNGRRAVL